MKKWFFVSICCLFWACQKYPDVGETVFEKNTLKFAVIGDWGREGNLEQRLVAHQLDRVADLANLDFIIATGDNFYETGVKSTSDSAWIKSFKNVYKNNKTWFVALGNHDYQGNTQAQVDYTKLNPQWQMPNQYFTFTKSLDVQTAIRFIFIDTTPFVKYYYTEPTVFPDVQTQNLNKQLAWLDSVLVNSKEKFKIVVGHHPVFSVGDLHGHTPELIEILKPKLDKYRVNLYLAGHEHALQYLKVDNLSTHYIVSGGGSEVRGVTFKPYPAQFAEASLGFSVIEISQNTIIGRFIDEKGRVIWEKNLE